MKNLPKAMSNMFGTSMLRHQCYKKGVEDELESTVNRTADISNQALANSGGDVSILY
jgi:hypothetical protein